MHRATAELIASGAASRALKAGGKVPAFMPSDSEGSPVTLAQCPQHGPLVASFYRGVWCTYCNGNCRVLQAALPAFTALGARLIAISPQLPVNSRKSIRQNALTFPILPDRHNEVAAAFGLRFDMPDYLIERYKSLKNDLPTFDGDRVWRLPMPTRYVIDHAGAIAHAQINLDCTQRPEPLDMLPALRQASATPWPIDLKQK